MAKLEQSPLFRLGNRMVKPLIRWGLPIGARRAPMALLTVPGRKTGIPRVTPVALAPTDDGWLLVAVYGVCDWSRNLEAAGRGTVTMRGRDMDVGTRRLKPREAGPVLRDSVLGTPAMVRRMTAVYFSADETSSLEEWERESINHPVFILTPLRNKGVVDEAERLSSQ